MVLVLALSAEAADATGRVDDGTRTETARKATEGSASLSAGSDRAGPEGAGSDEMGTAHAAWGEMGIARAASGEVGAARAVSDEMGTVHAVSSGTGIAHAVSGELGAKGAGPDGVRPGADVEGFDFTVPDELSAHEPSEARGVPRDQVRMLVGRRPGLQLSHHVAADLPHVLRAGDLLVVNNSGTLPAALEGRLPDGRSVALHVSSAEPGAGGEHLVELRRPWRGTTKPFGAGTSPARAGLVVALPGGAAAQLTAEFTRRLWYARFRFPSRGGEPEARGPAAVGDGASSHGMMTRYLARHGKPIRYSYVDRDWPLSAYQTAFAVEPGSSEMPSAARPFTPELVAALVSRGVLIAPITLHTGVASPEAHEAPYAERYRVPESTARLVNHVHASGGRVIAVGTTAVRALESAVDADAGVDVDIDVDVDGNMEAQADVRVGVGAHVDGDERGEARDRGRGGVDSRSDSRGRSGVGSGRDSRGRDSAGNHGDGRSRDGVGSRGDGRSRGRVHVADGWTDLVITPERGVRVVDGLLTGWHEPRASHLLMLEAVAGRPLLDLCYAEAIREQYLWHEFGDINLLLRDD